MYPGLERAFSFIISISVLMIGVKYAVQKKVTRIKIKISGDINLINSESPKPAFLNIINSEDL